MEEFKEVKTNDEIQDQDWILKELEEVKISEFDGERKDSLKLEENKITEFDIDFSKPFQKWVDSIKGTVKKLIPVKHAGKDLIWWLNVKNPIYKEVLEKHKNEKQTHFKVLQIGKQDKTQYKIVE